MLRAFWEYEVCNGIYHGNLSKSHPFRWDFEMYGNLQFRNLLKSILN